MIFYICWLGYEGNFPEGLWDRLSESMFPPACSFRCEVFFKFWFGIIEVSLLGCHSQDALQRFSWLSNVLFIFYTAIRHVLSENQYIVPLVCSSDALCIRWGIAWCGTCLFSKMLLKLHFSGAHLCCEPSQPLPLLSNQLHLLVLVTSKWMQRADYVLYVNILKSNQVKLV